MRVLITGAAGLVGGILWEGLAARYTLTGIDLHGDRTRGIRRADVRSERAVRRAVRDVDAVVDLATGSALSLDWAQVEKDIAGRLVLLEAMREHGVRRYVFASSNHVSGLYESDQPYAAIVSGSYQGLDPGTVTLIAPDWPIRPDSPYGVGKAFAEAAARFHAERHDLSAVCLRIGSVRGDDRPAEPRHYATLLSHADLVLLVDCSLQARLESGYGIYYGVSANTWRIWDIANAARELGFEPHDDAERLRPVDGG